MSHPMRVKADEHLNLPIIDAHSQLRIPVIQTQDQNNSFSPQKEMDTE